MKKRITSIVLLITGLASYAQQDAQFSMNMFNRLAVNPAYAGMNKALCGTLLYRQQWTSFPGAPKTGLLSVDFGEVLFGGVGLTIDQDQLGFDRTLKAKLAYSFHLPLGPGSLGIGLDAGMIQKSLSGNFIDPSGNTSASPGTDMAIPWSGTAATTYDVGLGLYYTTNRLYVGISSMHLPQQQLSKTGAGYDFNYKVARHYYVMAGYTFQLGNQFDLTPSVLTKSDASATQLDLNLIAKWNKMIFGGFSYRLSDAMVGIIGLEKSFTPKLTAKFGYSYDITTSTIKNHSSGSHEIMLGFCYKIKGESKPTSHMNVRFL
ncbi:MAG: type IX secretion system membrane protein PorP/SprF [Bacteroidota bacterium]